MRMFRLLIVLLMVAGGYLLYSWQEHRRQSEEELIRVTERAVQRISQEIKVQAATQNVELNARGWPVTIDPEWFRGAPPHNRLTPASCPWLEIAAGSEQDLDHPTHRLALDRSTPAFWYNPGKGIVRARVGPMISDKRALEVYNRVNHARLVSLFDDGSIRGRAGAATANVDTSRGAASTR